MYRADLEWAAYGFGEFSLGVSDVTFDQSGKMWTVDRGGRAWTDRDNEQRIDTDVVRCWSPDGQVEQTLGAGLFMMPHSITVCEDGVIVTDVGLHQVLKLNFEGELEWALGRARMATDELDGFNLPTDVVLCEDGGFFVSDGYGNARVLKFDRDRRIERYWGQKGDGAGEFRLPHSLDILDGSTVVVADRENSRIQLFDLAGAHLRTIQSGTLGKPYAVSIRDRRIYMADNGFPQEKRAGVSIFDLDSEGEYRFGALGKGPGEMLGPHSLAVDQDHNVYVADVVRGLLKFTPT
ncbi:MAG: peptidyl-alpha-hydroxyglycine alpha-amidating lyase family protein [Hyphomonas sp.]